MDARAVPPQLILIHYAEIGLKGKNRRFFERQLMRNIEAQLAGLDVAGLERMSGRLLLRLGESRPVEAVTRRLARTFGIAYVAPAYGLPRDVETMKEVIGRRVRQRTFASFKIETRRTDKRFPLTSVELNRVIGAHVQQLTGAAVDLRQPELTVHIVILYDSAFFYFERIPGPGGLPV
ncbi:MAG: tRNA 4-thiouridine(8) synthase ThiI, partial [Chloroflexi bacterium]